MTIKERIKMGTISNFDIKQIANDYNLSVFIETCTFKGRTRKPKLGK